VCKLVFIECGLRMQRMGNGYVQRNERLNLSIIIIIIIIISSSSSSSSSSSTWELISP
jgi:hypothetical protein